MCPPLGATLTHSAPLVNDFLAELGETLPSEKDDAPRNAWVRPATGAEGQGGNARTTALSFEHNTPSLELRPTARHGITPTRRRTRRRTPSRHGPSGSTGSARRSTHPSRRPHRWHDGQEWRRSGRALSVPLRSCRYAGTAPIGAQRDPQQQEPKDCRVELEAHDAVVVPPREGDGLPCPRCIVGRPRPRSPKRAGLLESGGLHGPGSPPSRRSTDKGAHLARTPRAETMMRALGREHGQSSEDGSRSARRSSSWQSEEATAPRR